MKYHQLVRLVLIIFAITSSVRALPSSNALEEKTGSTEQNRETTNSFSGDAYTIQSPSHTSNLQTGTSDRSSSNKIDSSSGTTSVIANSADKSSSAPGDANDQKVGSESESSPTTSTQSDIPTTSQLWSEASKSSSVKPEVISSSQQKTETTSLSIPSSTSSIGTSLSSASDRAVGLTNSGGSSNTYDKKTSSQTVYTISSDTETKLSNTPTTIQSSSTRSGISSDKNSGISAGLTSDSSVKASSSTSSTSDQLALQTSKSQDINTISSSSGAPTSSPASSFTALSDTTSTTFSDSKPALITGQSSSLSTDTPLASSISNTQSSQNNIADDTDRNEGTSSKITTNSETSPALNTQNVVTSIPTESKSTLTINDTPLTSSSQSTRPTSSITDELTSLTSTPASTASSDSTTASGFSWDNPFANELFVNPSTTSDATQSTASNSDTLVGSTSSSSAISVTSTSPTSADQATTSTGHQLTWDSSSSDPTFTVSTDTAISSSESKTNPGSDEELISTSFEEPPTSTSSDEPLTSTSSDFSQTSLLSSSSATDGVTFSTDSSYQPTWDSSSPTPTFTVPTDTTISSSEPEISSESSGEFKSTSSEEQPTSSSTGEQSSSSSIDTSITSSPIDSAGEGEQTFSKSSSEPGFDQSTSTPTTTVVIDVSGFRPLPSSSSESSLEVSHTSSSTFNEPDTASTMPSNSYGEGTSTSLTSDTSESSAPDWDPSSSTTATPPLSNSQSTSDDFEQSTTEYSGPSSTTSTPEVPIITLTSSSEPVYTLSTTTPSSSSILTPITTDATRDSSSVLQTNSANTITNPISSLSSFGQSSQEYSGSAPHYTDTSSSQTTGSIFEVTLATSTISSITSQDSPTFDLSYITSQSSISSTSTSGNVGGEIATSITSVDTSNIDIGQSSYESPSQSSLTTASQFQVSQDGTSSAMETGSVLNGQPESTGAQSFTSDIASATSLTESSYDSIATEEPTSSSNLETIDSSSKTATATYDSDSLSNSIASQQASGSSDFQTNIGTTSSPFDTATSTFLTSSLSDSMVSEQPTVSNNPQDTHSISQTETLEPSSTSSGTSTDDTQPNDTGSESLSLSATTRSSVDLISGTESDGSLRMTLTTRPAQSTGSLLTTGQTTAANTGARSSSVGGRTTFWLPSSIQVQSDPTRSGTSSFDPAVTATLPQLIAPPTAVPVPENASKITVGFKKNLNYEFLVSSSTTAAQIFHFLPFVLSFPFEENGTKDFSYKRRGTLLVSSFEFNNTTTLMPAQFHQETVTGISKRSDSEFPFNASAVDVIQIMPMIIKDRNYLTSIAVLYFPSAYVSELQSMVSDDTSQLFNNPDPTLDALAALIDPSIPLTGLIDGSTGSLNGGNPSTQSHSPSSPYKSQSSDDNSGSLGTATNSGLSSAVKKRLVIYLTCLVFGTLLWILVFMFLYKHLYGGRVIAKRAYQRDAAQEEKQHYNFADITSVHSAETEPANDKSDDVPQEKDVASASQSRYSLPEDLMITGENTVYSVSQGLQYFVAEDGSFYYAGPLQSTSEENETTKGDSADIEDINDYLYSADQERSIVTNEQSSCDIGSLQIDEEGNFVVSDPSPNEEEHEFTSSNSATIELYNNNNLYKMTRTVNSNEISSPRYLDQDSQGEISDAGMGQEGNPDFLSSTEQNWHISSPDESENFPGRSVFGFYGSDDSNNIVQSLPAENCIDEFLYVSGDDDSLLDSPLGVRIEEIDDDAVDVHVDDLDELDEEMYKRRSKLMTQQQRTENGMLHMSRVMKAKAQGTRRI